MPRTSTTFNSDSAKKAQKTALPEVQAKKNGTQKMNKLIKGEIYNELRKAIIDSDGKTKPFYQEYIHKLCKEGLRDPNSPIGRLWAEQLLQQDIISMLDEQTLK